MHATLATAVRKGWEEDRHPRADDGKFGSGSGGGGEGSGGGGGAADHRERFGADPGPRKLQGYGTGIISRAKTRALHAAEHARQAIRTARTGDEPAAAIQARVEGLAHRAVAAHWRDLKLAHREVKADLEHVYGPEATAAGDWDAWKQANAEIQEAHEASWGRVTHPGGYPIGENVQSIRDRDTTHAMEFRRVDEDHDKFKREVEAQADAYTRAQVALIRSVQAAAGRAKGVPWTAVRTKAGQWDEAKHPRADDGEFGSGGGKAPGKKPARKPAPGKPPAKPRTPAKPKTDPAAKRKVAEAKVAETAARKEAAAAKKAVPKKGPIAAAGRKAAAARKAHDRAAKAHAKATADHGKATAALGKARARLGAAKTARGKASAEKAATAARLKVAGAELRLHSTDREERHAARAAKEARAVHQGLQQQLAAAEQRHGQAAAKLEEAKQAHAGAKEAARKPAPGTNKEAAPTPKPEKNPVAVPAAAEKPRDAHGLSGLSGLSDPGVTSKVTDLWSSMASPDRQFVDGKPLSSGQGLAYVGDMHRALERQLGHDVPPEEFRGLLTHLWRSGAVEMAVLNEIRKMPAAERPLAVDTDAGANAFVVVKDPDRLERLLQQYGSGGKGS